MIKEVQKETNKSTLRQTLLISLACSMITVLAYALLFQPIQTLQQHNHQLETQQLQIEELIKIVGAAKALTLVSYFEGFGIPLVEAMRCGTPIITSNKTALPEVAGDCGLLVDPFDIGSISSAMSQFVNDQNLQTELAQKSLERAKLFSWDQSAKIIWNEIDALLK